MKKQLFLALVLLFLLTGSLFSQDTTRKATWLPKGNLFPTLRLNFGEFQTSAAAYGYWANKNWQNRVFGIFSVGLRRNVIRWNHGPTRASELGIDLAVFTQFLFEEPFEQFLVNLFNIEFKIGLHYQYKLDKWRFRGRVYHLSAHLGDDYIFRYDINNFIDNQRIINVVDFSAAWLEGPWQLYGTFGIIFHSTYERKPLLMDVGAQFEKSIANKDWLRWTAGVDLRFEQEQDFRPGIHTGAGIVLGKKESFPFTIMVDYYYGYLPYSLYDKMLIQWIGASIYFDI